MIAPPLRKRAKSVPVSTIAKIVALFFAAMILEVAFLVMVITAQVPDIWRAVRSWFCDLKSAFPRSLSPLPSYGATPRAQWPAEAVEKRFAATRAPHAMEHLSDNGSAYTTLDTRLFAQALNLTPCSRQWPVRSPTVCPRPSSKH